VVCNRTSWINPKSIQCAIFQSRAFLFLCISDYFSCDFRFASYAQFFRKRSFESVNPWSCGLLARVSLPIVAICWTLNSVMFRLLLSFPVPLCSFCSCAARSGSLSARFLSARWSARGGARGVWSSAAAAGAHGGDSSSSWKPRRLRGAACWPGERGALAWLAASWARAREAAHFERWSSPIRVQPNSRSDWTAGGPAQRSWLLREPAAAQEGTASPRGHVAQVEAGAKPAPSRSPERAAAQHGVTSGHCNKQVSVCFL
jgi:hypothetical protein